MNKMSVTRALAELKRLDDRIANATTQGQFVAVAVGKETNMKVNSISGVTVDQMKSKIQSSFDLLTSLFTQRENIKAAIVKSNATTCVQVGGKTYTVAEAIELKRSIENKRNLVRHMKSQYNTAQSTVAQLNAKLDADIDSNLKTIYGSDKSKSDKDTYDTIAKPQKALKEASLIDTVDIVAKIASFEDEISLIDTELDFTLSEINAKTDIEV